MSNTQTIGPSVSTENIGALITDITRIFELAKGGKCVVYRGGRTPAAFIQNFYAIHLHREIQRKVLFEYKSIKNVKRTYQHT